LRANGGNYFYEGKWRSVEEAYEQATEVAFDYWIRLINGQLIYGKIL
jgi:hypothetical protein